MGQTRLSLPSLDPDPLDFELELPCFLVAKQESNGNYFAWINLSCVFDDPTKLCGNELFQRHFNLDPLIFLRFHDGSVGEGGERLVHVKIQRIFSAIPFDLCDQGIAFF